MHYQQQQQQTQTQQPIMANLDAINKSRELKVVRKQVAKLYDDLDLSISIQTIWPDAFAHGKVKSKLTANMFNLDQAKVVFRNDKEEKTFKLVNLPAPIKHQKLNQIYNQAEDSQKGEVARQINKLLGTPFKRGNTLRDLEKFLNEH